MKVTIDGVEYAPLSHLGANGDLVAKAVIRSLISGYYAQLECNKDGSAPDKSCECSSCHIHRVAVQFLGGEPESEEEQDPGFQKLYKATEV